MEQLKKKMDLLQIGQTVVVETQNELLEGMIEYVNKKWSIIELKNARDIRTNCIYSSTQLLHFNQLLSVKLLTPDNCVIDSTPSTSTISVTTKRGNENFVQLSSTQLNLIQKQLNAKVYITQTDQKYHSALKDIKMQSVVSLWMEPANISRHSRTSIITVATCDKIYIFDLYSLAKISNEFGEIFKLQSPRKVIHISHKYVDNMYHRHQIELSGIFDTFVAYCLITGNKEPKTLEETVQDMLGLSPKYFQVVNNNPAVFNCRPLSEEMLLGVSKKAALQLQLYEFLLHKKLLHSFYEQCENFSRTLVENEDEFEVAQALHERSHAGFDRIKLDENWKSTLHLNSSRGNILK